MDLSIIVINWNTRDMLRDCLNSVLDNEHPAATELIVADNASTDGSQQMVVAEFPEVQLVANEDNLGFALANNIAMERAKGRYVLLLNSDTLVHGPVLKDCFDYMERAPDAGAMGCRVLNRDGSLQHSTSHFPTLKNLLVQTTGLEKISALKSLREYRMLDWDRRDQRSVETISGCFMFMRRACLEDVGLLDNAFFFFGEETDWCRRAREAGWGIDFAPVGEITHFGGGSSGSLNHRRDLMLSQATVRLHLKHGGIIPAVLVFATLLVFNLSRALFWELRAAISPATSVKERASHFVGVTRNFLKAWPREKGVAI
jgi:GT2 family glycosyltransferase